MNPDLMKQLLSSIQLGLNTFTTEIQSFCFDFIVSVATVVYFDKDPSSVTYNLLLPFVEIIFNMIITRQIDQENKNESYSAIFVLACTFKEQFQYLMDKLVTSQTNQLVAERLQVEYNEFKTNLELVNNRQMKNRFSDKFDKFVTAIGFITNT